MAKKKKKKQSKVCPAGTLPIEEIQPVKDASEKAIETPPRKGGVSIATCVAGMLLTLVLGIYLGTLIPFMKQENPTPPISEQSPQEQAQVNKEPKENPHMTQELAARLKSLQELVIKDPNNAANWAELGNLYFDIHEFRSAISAYETSLKFNPQNPDVWTDLGIMYRETEQFEKAINCFKKASSINPAHQNAIYNEGLVYSTDLHNRDMAIAAWSRLLQLNPNAHGPDGSSVEEMIRKLKR